MGPSNFGASNEPALQSWPLPPALAGQVWGLVYAIKPDRGQLLHQNDFQTIVAFSTARITIHPYLGYMQPLRREDVFTGFDAQVLDKDAWSPPPESSFDTIRGLLMAGVLGLPAWAVVILVCWMIWL
jgi:hypothetical protein